jgi:hypothetical protein
MKALVFPAPEALEAPIAPAFTSMLSGTTATFSDAAHALKYRDFLTVALIYRHTDNIRITR